nr:hypothetical protein [Candidatus Woesearchaeota archaeon]
MDESWWYGIIAGFCFGAATGITFDNYTQNKIPTTGKVQQGYVVPSRLEIKVQDLDRNGQNEVIMKYDGKNYLFTLDEQGKPRVQLYEIKSAEVVPK